MNPITQLSRTYRYVEIHKKKTCFKNAEFFKIKAGVITTVL